MDDRFSDVTSFTKKDLILAALNTMGGVFVEFHEKGSAFSSICRQRLINKLLSEQKFVNLCPVVRNLKNVILHFKRKTDAISFVVFLNTHFRWTFQVTLYTPSNFLGGEQNGK